MLGDDERMSIHPMPTLPAIHHTMHETKHRRTMILMSDSRSLHQTNDYHSLAYAINAHYAQQHGYRLRFYQTPCQPSTTSTTDSKKNNNTKDCIACTHSEFGGRMSPWCKLLAVNDTLHRYKDQIDRVVYMDSDAFVQNLQEPFQEVYFQKTLAMFWNKPWAGVCSGIQFWQNNDLARRMIAAWWNTNTSFHMRHDYEQSAFRQRNSPLMIKYASHIYVIPEWNCKTIHSFDTLPENKTMYDLIV